MRFRWVLLFMVILTACKSEMDVDQARQTAEQLITLADSLNFDAVEKIYSPAFRRSETMEDKIEKLKYLKRALGDLKKIEFQKHTLVEEFGQPRKLVLEYRVSYINLVTVQKISVVEEEGGYRVATHSIRNEDL